MKFCLDIKFIWVLMFISKDLGVIPASFPVLVSRSGKINYDSPLLLSFCLWHFKPHRIFRCQTEQYWSLEKNWNLKKNWLGKHPFLNLSDFLDNRPRWIRWVMECCSPILQMGVRCPHQRLRRKNWARWTRDMKIWPQCLTPSLKVWYEFIWSLLYLKLLIKVSFHMVFHFKLLIKVRFSCILV